MSAVVRMEACPSRFWMTSRGTSSSRSYGLPSGASGGRLGLPARLGGGPGRKYVAGSWWRETGPPPGAWSTKSSGSVRPVRARCARQLVEDPRVYKLSKTGKGPYVSSTQLSFNRDTYVDYVYRPQRAATVIVSLAKDGSFSVSFTALAEANASVAKWTHSTAPSLGQGEIVGVDSALAVPAVHPDGD